MNWRMYLAFVGWLFRKIFKKPIKMFHKFQYSLQTEFYLATFSYVIFSLVFEGLFVSFLITFIDDAMLGKALATYSCYVLIIFYVFNLLYSQFQEFKREREEIFNVLKR